MIAPIRILWLGAAVTLVTFSASSIPVRAQEPNQNRKQTIVTSDECHQQRRAISRRTCYARLSNEMHVETADKN